jgi:hypothetical protein
VETGIIEAPSFVEVELKNWTLLGVRLTPRVHTDAVIVEVRGPDSEGGAPVRTEEMTEERILRLYEDPPVTRLVELKHPEPEAIAPYRPSWKRTEELSA